MFDKLLCRHELLPNFSNEYVRMYKNQQQVSKSYMAIPADEAMKQLSPFYSVYKNILEQQNE